MDEDVVLEYVEKLERKVSNFLKLSDDFASYVNHLGLDSNSPICQVLLSDEQFVSVANCDTEIVKAWATWIISFQIEKSILWLKAGWEEDSPLDGIASILKRPEFMTSVVWRASNCIAELCSQSRITVLPPTHYAGCGFSITQLIVEGLVPDSAEWDDVVAPLLSVMRQDKRIVTICPPL